MSQADSFLQQVQTYQASELAYMHNSFAAIHTFNKKFRDFEKLTANLGSTVTFDKQPLFTTNNSLVAVFQAAGQRVQSLTVDNAVNTAYSFTNQQFIFNVREYMDKFGKAASIETGSVVEKSVLGRTVIDPYRFYGDGVTPLSSFTQLARALAYHRNYGAPRDGTKAYIPDIIVPNIVSTGLMQFVTKRNEEIAHSWQLGNFSNCEWYQSNLLPIQNAGTCGQNADTLTVSSVTRAADGGITSITCTGVTTNTGAIAAGDMFQFQDGVAGHANIRYFTFTGHQVSASPVQNVVTTAANGTSGAVTFVIGNKLYDSSSYGSLQNVSSTIEAGMQLKFLPSHIAGLILSGDAGFLAMPRLPEEIPFPTANAIDEESGMSFRKYYGSKFGMNERGFVNDVIWGSTIVPEYAMRLIIPIGSVDFSNTALLVDNIGNPTS